MTAAFPRTRSLRPPSKLTLRPSASPSAHSALLQRPNPPKTPPKPFCNSTDACDWPSATPGFQSPIRPTNSPIGASENEPRLVFLVVGSAHGFFVGFSIPYFFITLSTSSSFSSSVHLLLLLLFSPPIITPSPSSSHPFTMASPRKYLPVCRD